MTKRFLLLAKNHWGELAITVIALILTAVLNLVTPEVVRRFTASLESPQSLTSKLILTYILVLVLSYAARSFCRFISLYVSHVAAWNFVGELTLRVYDKLQRLSLNYYKDKQTGELMSRMVNDTRLLEVLIAHSLPDLISNVLIIIGVAIMIFLINPILALFTLIPVPFVLFASSFFSKKVAPLFKINQRVLGRLNGVLQDNLSGMKEIQAFCNEDYEYNNMKKRCAHYSKVNINANFANAIFNPSVEFLTSMGTVIVVGAGSVLTLKNSMPVSDIIGFFMYLSLFYQPLSILARLVEDVQNALAGGARVLEVLDADNDVKEADDAVSISKASGAIEFEDVSFQYEEGETVLKDISFKVNPGEIVAFVGPTGVGKTTIISLLERFYDPTDGKVLLDGIDIKSLKLSSLRNNISIVLQDVFLFNGTIAENIAYGLNGTTRKDIIDASKAACADEFVSKLPDGYDTKIGERGIRLSGGQKQRIAIARAVLRKASVLIMDEATSAVDTETEADIQNAIERLAGTKTIILIAHRLSTVQKADKIIVLNDGRIEEVGTHAELIKKQGTYSKLCGF